MGRREANLPGRNETLHRPQGTLPGWEGMFRSADESLPAGEETSAVGNEKLPPGEAIMGKQAAPGRARPAAGARTVGRGPQAPPPSGLRMRGERPGKASRRASRPSVLPADFMCL